MRLVQFAPGSAPAEYPNNFKSVKLYAQLGLYVGYYMGDDMTIESFTGELPAVDPVRIISIGALDERFTLDEAAAIEDSTIPTIKVLRTRLGRKAYIDLDDPKFAAALDALVIAGLLTAERKTEMLSDGTEAEAYRGVL